MPNNAWENFLVAARGGEPEQVPVALLVGSGYVSGA